MTRPGVGPSGPDAALTSWTDEALFERVCAGSEAHFNVLYARYFRRIYAFVYQRIRNHADAEELVQETFTVVFRGAANFGGRSSPLAWILTVRVRSSLERRSSTCPLAPLPFRAWRFALPIVVAELD